jgi:transposase-like protein
MNRIIPLKVKVKVMEESLYLHNVEEVARQNDVSPGAVRRWHKEKVLPSLENILENETPGPKPKDEESGVENATEEVGRPEKCDACGSRHIWKNGTYEVINWIWLQGVRS